MSSTPRTCENCGDPIKGRADKKFCSAECRSTFHYTHNRDKTNFMRRINFILRKNRNILETLNPNGKARSSRDQLLERGFKFNYYTNTYTTKAGATYYFVYEQGYLPIDEEYYALVIRQKYVE
jgi:predicted nucleic acid-binding Zn ribbon protein